MHRATKLSLHAKSAAVIVIDVISKSFQTFNIDRDVSKLATVASYWTSTHSAKNKMNLMFEIGCIVQCPLKK